MFTHKQVWTAIDAIAERYGFSASGLAKKSGLDPTSFNPSKRLGIDGRPRWPTTESISRVLAASGATMEEFTSLLSGRKGQPARRRIALLGFAQAGLGGYFDDSGFPSGGGWDEIEVPDVTDANAYALEIAGNSMEPVYREGDIIVISPASTMRKGDRVVLKTKAGEVMAKILQRQTAKTVEVSSFNPDHPPKSFNSTDVDWVARIIWASQ